MSKYLMSPVLVEFFYDVISPYSFFAFEVLCRYKTRWNINLKLKPVLLRGVITLSGNSPPFMVPSRAMYILQDLKRLQKYFQVPMKPADDLYDTIVNKGSLNAQRFVTAVDVVCPEHTENVSRQLWLRVYDTHEDIITIENLRQAGSRAGMRKDEIEKCLSMINERQIKERLTLCTQQAIDYGAFGAPYIVAHINGKPEPFFGSDRFEFIAHCLGEKWNGPLPSSL